MEDIGKLLNACEEGHESNPLFRRALTTRNKAIVVLFIDTGIYPSELVGLRLGDLDRRSGVILVHRKGNKWQQVPVSREGFKPLHSYLSNHRAILAGSNSDEYRPRKDDVVFLANDGEPLTVWGMSMLTCFSGIWRRLI